MCTFLGFNKASYGFLKRLNNTGKFKHIEYGVFGYFMQREKIHINPQIYSPPRNIKPPKFKAPLGWADFFRSYYNTKNMPKYKAPPGGLEISAQI